MGITTKQVEEVLVRAFLADRGLRVEDAQKAKELAPLLDEIARLLPKKRRAVLVDAAAGKAALGVFAASFFDGVDVVALEHEPARRKRAEDAARVLAVADRVRFVTTDVADVAAWPQEPDVVVALHACGAATDAVIDVAMERDARAILVVPCCYAGGSTHSTSTATSSSVRVVPGQNAADHWRAEVPLPDHGLVGRRFSQALIDAERTLRLEKHGWETEVLELFSPSVSPYNFLWRARRVKEPVRMRRASEKHAALVHDV